MSDSNIKKYKVQELVSEGKFTDSECKISLQPFTHVSIEGHFLNIQIYFASRKYLLHTISDDNLWQN